MENRFARQINVSLFDSLIQKNAHYLVLTKQYCMVAPIADGVSKAFYNDKLRPISSWGAGLITHIQKLHIFLRIGTAKRP